MASASNRKKSPVKGRARQTVPAHGNGALSREKIADLAYSYAEARGFQGGSQVEDWLKAEMELKRDLEAKH